MKTEVRHGTEEIVNIVAQFGDRITDVRNSKVASDVRLKRKQQKLESITISVKFKKGPRDNYKTARIT
jgi:hypothetical protein